MRVIRAWCDLCSVTCCLNNPTMVFIIDMWHGQINSHCNLAHYRYVELRRKQRLVVRHHKEALAANCAFWRAMQSNNVSFTSLSKAVNKLEDAVAAAETAYCVVLEQYDNNPRLVRLYAKFLETVKTDPWGASE